MQAATPRWPQRQDYDDSMLDMVRKVYDPIIKFGKLEQHESGITRFGGANNYITIYKVDDWIVRCFCRDDARGKKPPSDIEARYQHISKFCKKHAGELSPLSYMEYVPNAIEVDFIDRLNHSYTLIKNDILPFVRIKFISGLSLDTFIGKHYKDSSMMEALCNAWVQMVYILEKLHMAHGDLDLTNIIVQEQTGNIVLKLIDYDNAWVPAFHGYDLVQTEVGKEHFQHPALRSKATWALDEYMDRFSALTIYISLKVLATCPDLYKIWGAGTSRLLLTKADYESEMQSLPNQISILRNEKISELEPLLRELSLCLIERRQPHSLTELLHSHIIIASRGSTFEFSTPQSASITDCADYSEKDLRWYRFDKAESFIEPDKPLVPLSRGEPATDSRTQMAGWGKPEYEIEQLLLPPTQQSQQAPWLPTEPITKHIPPRPRSTQAKRSTASFIALLIMLILVALIIVAILWFTISMHHQATTPSWMLSSIIQALPLKHWILESCQQIGFNT